MLFKARFWAALEDGSLQVAFRRWKRPTVKAGGRLRSPRGLLSIDAVTPIAINDITAADATAAGYDSLDDLLRELVARDDGELYRIDFHRIGEDDRIALRNDDALTPDDRAAIDARLARLDKASATGPWTTAVLRLIAERPAVRAGDLAEVLGYERLPFKVNVRKLKALGLTESLGVGYRLSPRGRAYLEGIPD